MSYVRGVDIYSLSLSLSWFLPGRNQTEQETQAKKIKINQNDHEIKI